MASWLPSVSLTLLPHVGGIAGGFITKYQVKNWYNKVVEKPSWRPPNWLFAPVWTTLYTSMGYASYLIYRDAVGSDRKLALALYGTQLGLNWIWTPLFFYYHKLGLAATEIVALWATIGATTWSFYGINKNAAYLMVPYFLWVSFASALSIDIWRRNKGRKLE